MSEITKIKAQRSKTRDRIIWILFAVIIVFIYFFGLSIPLLGPDEPRYAQVAREMFQRGDWITPTLGGFDWFEKPALLYWLQILSYKIFGVSEFSARFGSALFGLGTIFSLWILGCQRSDAKLNCYEFANWLALIAASSIGLLVFSRGASFDIILTFPTTASLVSFFIWEVSRRETQKNKGKFSKISVSSVALAGFYFFIGVALLAKGLIGVVFPIAIVAFYYVLSWKPPNKTFFFSLIWGTILSFLIASVWYLPMFRAHGWKFVDEFFIQHHFQRYASNKYQHPQPFWFFFLVLPLMTVPWLPFFSASLWKFFKNQKSKFKTQRSELRTQNLELGTFAFAWMLVPLVFFSLSGSKLPGYILPALPGALILTAEYVFEFAQKQPKRKFALQFLAFLTFAVVALLLQFVAPKFAFADSTKNLIEIADANGYSNEKIVNLYTVSHNAEFYAAGRLLREPDGKLKRYDDFSVLVNELKMTKSERILVLVPQKDVVNLVEESSSVEIKPLAENGELAIILAQAN